MSNQSSLARIVLVAIGVPLLLALSVFGYWVISPLFTNVVVSEALSADGFSILKQGSFVGADAVIHHAEGQARLLRTRDAQLLVRFEDDFKASNGPDLYVYLVKDGDPNEGFLDLGKLKGNIGSQSYVVPADADLSQYNSVIVWCKAFSVLFGTAQLL